MLLEEYIKELQSYIAKALQMFEKLIQTSESVSLDYVADEESVEADIEITDADMGLLQASVEKSRISIGEISVGLKQVLERYETLCEVSERRNQRIKQLDGKLYEQVTGDKVNDSDDDAEIRKLYAPLLEGLSEFEIQQRLTQLKKIRGN
jgi:hypothetical protein